MIRAIVLDELILLTEVKILEGIHLCYHEVISVVITDCCRNGKKSRHGVMAYVYCISKLAGNISYDRCGVIQDVYYVVACKKEDGREAIVDQRNVDIGKAADAVVQTEYVYEELSTKIRSVNLLKFRGRCFLNVKQVKDCAQKLGISSSCVRSITTII